MTLHKKLDVNCVCTALTRSWVPEVQTAGSGDSWDGNALRFSRKEDAEAWVADLAIRWTAVREMRVVPSSEEPNR